MQIKYGRLQGEWSSGRPIEERRGRKWERKREMKDDGVGDWGQTAKRR